MSAQKFADAISEYHALGFDTIPLLPNSKDAFLDNWQARTPADLWACAPTDCNIGIRCGGALHVVIFDADDKKDRETSGRVLHFLDGLGLHEGNYPFVQTVNDGRHSYIALDRPLNGAFKHLPRELGTGEIRFGPGAYCAAPPSKVERREYKLLAGDFANLPRVEFVDLRDLIGREIGANESHEHIPESKPRKRYSRQAGLWLRGKNFEKFNEPGKNTDRSDAEFAILCSLANSRFEFVEVLQLFLTNPCAGKFAEMYAKNPDYAIGWLRHSFDNALAWTNSHESEGQRIARRALEFAQSYIWQGQTGSIDRAVFIAHVTLAYKSGSVVYAAGARDLAELAAVSHWTATNATRRLIAMGLLKLEQKATFNFATTYRILDKDVCNLPTLSPLHVGERQCMHTSDVFRWHGIGKAAEIIWANLLDGPKTIQELAKASGRDRSTVSRIVKHMNELEMVAPIGARGRQTVWQAQVVDFEDIARKLGTLGMSEKQRQKHMQERMKRRELWTRNG